VTAQTTIVRSGEVVDCLRDSIVKGAFSPGDRLREVPLATALGVSRGPIRSALHQLEREGLVIKHPNRRAIVAELSRNDVDEVYSLRLAIEPVVCAWAARNAVAEDLAAMQEIVDRHSKITTRITDHEAAEVDLAFHDAIYRAARHRRLLSLWRDLRPQVYVFLKARPHVRSREFRALISQSHQGLLDAIAQGEAQRASDLATAHMKASYLRVIACYGGESAAADAAAGSGPASATRVGFGLRPNLSYEGGDRVI
jgi:DNA-binding GntR family transcriptional regulator